MIVWSGSGIMVAAYNFVFFVLAIMATSAMHLAEPLAMAAGFASTGLLSAAATFLTVRLIENKPGRTYIDEATSQRVEVKPSAGSFFFIPTRYWPYINVVVGAGLAYTTYTSPPLPVV